MAVSMFCSGSQNACVAAMLCNPCKIVLFFSPPFSFLSFTPSYSFSFCLVLFLCALSLSLPPLYPSNFLPRSVSLPSLYFFLSFCFCRSLCLSSPLSSCPSVSLGISPPLYSPLMSPCFFFISLLPPLPPLFLCPPLSLSLSLSLCLSLSLSVSLSLSPSL